MDPPPSSFLPQSYVQCFPFSIFFFLKLGEEDFVEFFNIIYAVKIIKSIIDLELLRDLYYMKI